MNVGELIKKVRTARKLTQKQLADNLGIAEITVRQYEANKRAPSLEQLPKIAEALGVEWYELMGIPKVKTVDTDNNGVRLHGYRNISPNEINQFFEHPKMREILEKLDVIKYIRQPDKIAINQYKTLLGTMSVNELHEYLIYLCKKDFERILADIEDFSPRPEDHVRHTTIDTIDF